MFSNWSGRKKVTAATLVAVGLLVALFAVLTVDGTLYERWRVATHLRGLYKGWVLDGSPYPVPEPLKYGSSSAGTAYVYTVSQFIDGRTCQGLFAYRDYARPTVFAITTNGICLVLRDDGSARLMWIHKTRGAAW
jgi:hypothetical protein